MRVPSAVADASIRPKLYQAVLVLFRLVDVNAEVRQRDPAGVKTPVPDNDIAALVPPYHLNPVAVVVVENHKFDDSYPIA